MTKGQPIRETLGVLQELAKHGLVFTEYKMTAYTRDGNKLEIKYNVKDDERFKGG